MHLSAEDLEQMPVGTAVKDPDGDVWKKNDEFLWTMNDYSPSSSYYGWSAHRLTTTYDVTEVTPVVTSDVLRPAPEYVSESRTDLRMETLSAQDAWLGEGYDSDLFDRGVANGWFTDKFFQDLAEGEAF